MSTTSISLIRPKSVLHYWLRLSQSPSYDFIRLLDYLSERDLGILEIALSERNMRQLYIEPLKVYYATHEIVIANLKYSKTHLDWVLNKGLNSYIQKLVISNEGSKDLDYKCIDKLIFCNLLEITCFYITPEICNILSSNLQILEISGDTSLLTDACIQTICIKCQSLKHIEITSPELEYCLILTHLSLYYITYYCLELEVLIIRDWNDYNEQCDDYLYNLTTLGILELDVAAYGPCVSNDVLMRNNRLETVNLATGLLYHGIVMRGLGEHCHLLRHVCLSTYEWYDFTDEGIIAMVQGCPLLETIELNGWDATEEVEFQHSVSVTNASMYAIAHYCSNLISFSISSIDALAYDCNGLDAIVQGCPRLQVIYRDEKVYYTAPAPAPIHEVIVIADTLQSSESDDHSLLDHDQPHVSVEVATAGAGAVAGGGLVSRCIRLANETAYVVCTYTVQYLYDMVLQSGGRDSGMS